MNTFQNTAPRRIRREGWVNVYGDGLGDLVHGTRADADACAAPSRVACVKVVIDCEEGEGLDERGGPTRTKTNA